jgi:hypothetical protein
MPSTSSIFIPSIHRSVNETYLSAMVGDYGKVIRIDFFEMAIPKRCWRRAAVYFEEEIELDDNETCSYQVNNNMVSCILAVNQHPVEYSKLNEHQIVHELNKHSEILESHELRIDALFETINKMNEIIKAQKTQIDIQKQEINNNQLKINDLENNVKILLPFYMPFCGSEIPPPFPLIRQPNVKKLGTRFADYNNKNVTIDDEEV